MKRYSKFAILALFCSFLLLSCAQQQSIRITSDPPGAEIRADGRYLGTTPLSTAMSADLSLPNYTITAKLAGYKEATAIAKDDFKTTFDPIHFKLDPVILQVPASIVMERADTTKNRITNHTSKGKSWALVIGISKYRNADKDGLTNLIFADDDAISFSNSLKNLGLSKNTIKILTNQQATKMNIQIALEAWLSKAGPNDQIILFWSGHGYPDPEDPEKVYFACYDTDINIPVTGYRMDRVRGALEERKVKNVVILADTCHAGKIITRGGRGISVVPEIEKMKREQNVPKGWIFMVGADTDRQAIEHTSWTNGAFTHSLINGLSGKADGYESAGLKDDIVTMGELKAYMNTAMPDETQKVLGVAKRPVITTSTGDPDIWNLTLQAK